MFRALRNRLIVINVIVTTVVLTIAFSTIYLVARNVAGEYPKVTKETVEISQDMSQMVVERILIDRRTTLRSLLWSLMMVGALVEVAVMVLSYALAEAAIRPIKEAYEMQKTFISNASHEMKTPLAAIEANLEAAEIEGNRWIDNTVHEVKWMTQLNNELLTLTRADNAKMQRRAVEKVSLELLAEEVMRDFEASSQAKGIKMKMTGVSTQEIGIVKTDAMQVLTILVDNAIKYGKTKVTCRVGKDYICIENDGTKIAPEEMERIFDRFYQVDKSKNSDGAGLGLAIAATIAKNNHWRIKVESDKTTRFTVEFR